MTPGGPAQRAGIQPGDMIYKLDDHPVGTVDDIRHHLERLADGRAGARGAAAHGAKWPRLPLRRPSTCRSQAPPTQRVAASGSLTYAGRGGRRACPSPRGEGGS